MMTSDGVDRFKLFADYGLESFYNKEVGNLVITADSMTVNCFNAVMLFLMDNTDWVAGFMDVGNGELVLFVTDINDLL